MKTEKKVLLGFLLLGLLIALISYFLARPVTPHLIEVERIQNESLMLIQNVQSKTMEAVEESFAYVVSGEVIEKNEFLQWVENFSGDFKQFTDHVALHNLEAEGKNELTANIIHHQNELSEYAKQLFLEYEENGAVSKNTFDKYESSIDVLGIELKKLIENEHNEIRESQIRVSEIIQSDRNRVHAVGALTLIFCLAFGFFLYFQIKRENALRIKIEGTNKLLLETTDICLKEIHKNEGPGYTLISMSPAGPKQLGITNIEKYFGGPYPADVYPDEANKVTTEALDRLVSTGESTQVECELFDIHGNSVWYLTTYSILRKNEAGEIVSINGSSQNITQRKKDQEALFKYSKDLARSNQELQDFALVASHDLQEPLRKITTFGDRVMESAANLDEKSRDYIQRMQKATIRMSHFIEDLLHYSKITAQPLLHEGVDLEELVNSVCEQLDHVIHSNNGEVNISNLPVIEGSQSQLNQLFCNLILNSFKYRSNDKPPVINIFGRMKENGSCEIVVKDNGIGFDEKYLDRIFLPFQRLHGRSEYEGSGLGLTICKKIVDRHNGIISAQSKPNEGATFIITFPTKQPTTH